MNSENDHQFDYVMAGLPGIIIGMVIYSVSVSAVIGAINFNTASPPGISGFALWGLAAGCSVGLGVFFGAACGLLALMLLNFLNFAIGYPFRPATVIAGAGGLAGFLVPAFVVLNNFPVGGIRDVDFEFVMAILLGPVLGMVLGHMTAAWYERNQLRTICFLPRHRTHLQFRILHLLLLTTLAALLLIGGKALQPQFPNIGLLIVLYIVLQTLLFGLQTVIRGMAGSRVRHSVVRR